MVRILLAEDHAMVCAGLRQILDRQPDMRVIAEAQDGAEAINLALQLEPTVAILGLGMPDVDGLEALESIKTDAPHIRVLMLSGQVNEQYVRRALQGGASGYLLKRQGRPSWCGRCARWPAGSSTTLGPGSRRWRRCGAAARGRSPRLAAG